LGRYPFLLRKRLTRLCRETAVSEIVVDIINSEALIKTNKVTKLSAMP
jgi:hypothetical protein